ncbi:MAG: hypothetical protein O2888_05640 [Chloroflexi bacterium]|nr:hypothetical protein [Chloroflexota bacterium]
MGLAIPVIKATPATNAMPTLRPYQAEIARAILGRVASGRGGSISVEVSRQGGKNEVSAQVELVTLLAHAGRGGAIVKCAPTAVPQARLSADRLMARAMDAGVAAMVRRHGHTVRCGSAHAEFLSAEPGANVVGHTASLLLEVDEAQDVSPEKFDRDFRPMAASTNAPVVYYGTPWGPGSLLARARAEHLEAERRDGIRRVFRFDWEAVAEHVPAYRAYVAGERDRLGERHPLFRTQYLLEEVDESGRLFDESTLAQLQGSHPRLRQPLEGERYVAGLDLAGPGPAPSSAMSAGAGDEAGGRDWSVLTIARVRSGPDGLSDVPIVEVVEHQAWQAVPTDALVTSIADRLRRVWGVRRLAVDATGLGAPVADLLAARLGRDRVEAVVFTGERKSSLGFGLLAAAHSGRLRIYAADGSREYVACRQQLGWARADYRESGAMRFDVDPARGHDDYLMSLALAVHAAGGDTRPRVARGRDGEQGGVR